MRSNLSSDYSKEIIQELNGHHASKLLGNTVLHVLFLVLGVLGNAVIVYVYRWKLKRRRDGRFFIVLLAIVDLIHCIVSSSLVFVKNVKPLLFPGSGACKTLLYLTNWFFILSLLVLFLICIERYQKICRPFGKQLNQKRKVYATAILVLMSAVIPIPRLVYFEARPIKRGPVQGTLCGPNMTIPGADVVIPMLGLLNFILSGLVIVIMAILYGFVGRVVYRQNKRFSGMLSGTKTSSSSPTPSNHEHSDGRTATPTGSPSLERQPPRPVKSKSLRAFPTKQLSVDSREKMAKLANSPRSRSAGTALLNQTGKLSKSFVQLMHKNLRMNRCTIMFMVITLVTTLSYIPLWVYVWMDIIDPTRWFIMGTGKLLFFTFLRSFAALGYLANPFIYAYYDSLFRRELRRAVLGCSCVKKNSNNSS